MSDRTVKNRRQMKHFPKLADPATVDPALVREVRGDQETVHKNSGRSGTYLLVLENSSMKRIDVGKLGRVRFSKGYYVYVGSGMNGLDCRVARHYRTKKSTHWHIDHITPRHMPIVRCYKIRSALRLEEMIVKRCEKIAPGNIQGFGSSDSSRRSHLFFFPSPPHERRDFLDIVLDLMTFSENSNPGCY